MVLRSCYVTNASSVQKFIVLHRKITNYITVYNRVILPSASVVVQNIQDFIDTYIALSYDDFKECIENLANSAHKNQEMASYTKLLHQEILANFKNKENNVIGLSLIPDVNFIVSPILWYSGKEDLVKAIASEEESKLAIAATFIIRDVF
ncbi:10890_t:CDS:2 [Funneliformis geosporum]|nr:10890_t:CDS:2 [Funneliformis geosporum]